MHLDSPRFISFDQKLPLVLMRISVNIWEVTLLSAFIFLCRTAFAMLSTGTVVSWAAEVMAHTAEY